MKNRIVIGCKNFTEQEVLGEILALIIEKHSDLKIVRRFNLEGTMILFNAFQSGDIDIYPEYTGTGLITILKASPNESFDFLQSECLKKYDLVWLPFFGFHNDYAMIVRENSKLKTISDLAKYSHKNSVRFAFNPEFISRPEFTLLQETYEFNFRTSFVMLDDPLIYISLANNTIDASVGFATDGRIEGYHLQILEDDLHVFPNYEAAPIVRKEVLEKYPVLREVIGKLAGQISDEEMRQMNFLVDEKGKKPKEVAFHFLLSKGLISSQ